MPFRNQLKLVVLRVAPLLLIWGGFLIGPHPQPARAAANVLRQLPLSAKLQTTGYSNVSDGTYDIRFAIYTVDRTTTDAYPSNSDSGSRLWTETQSVTVSRGTFSVLLGSVSGLTSVDFNRDDLYLGIRVGTDSEMTPRKHIGSSPTAINADKLDSYHAADFTLDLVTTNGATTSNTLTVGGLASSGAALALQPASGYGITGAVTLTDAAGTAKALSLTPTINQSGTAGYTALFVNVTQSATGSGAKNLFDFQVGGVSMAKLDNAGALTVTSCTGCAGSGVALSGLTAATAVNTIANVNWAQTWNWDTLTTENAFTFGSTSISSGSLLNLSVNSTAAASNTQKALNISTAGTNGTATQTTYGLYAANTHAGATSTNVAGYFSASGGTTNYGLIVAAGNVGIATTTPSAELHVRSTTAAGGGIYLDGTSTYSPALTLRNDTTTKGLLGLALDTNHFVTGAAINDLILRHEGGNFIIARNSTAADITINTSGNVTMTPAASTSGSPTLFTLTGPAHTGLTALTEAIDVNVNLNRTVTWATGAITTQRAMYIQAPTYAFAAASTITNAATLAISGPPTAGAFATISNPAALVVETGNVGIGTAAPVTNLSVYNANESTTLTNFTQALTYAGINVMTDYTNAAYTPGIFWSTQDNNSTKPKAGIWMYEGSTGTRIYLGTTNAFATGITNNGLVLDESGNVGAGSVVSTTTRLIAKGQTADTTQWAFRALNSSDSELFSVRNDGGVALGGTTPGAKLDIQTTQTSGTIFKAAAPSAVTLAAGLTGSSIDLSTNYTATGYSVTGQSIAMPAVTNTGAGTYAYKGISLTTGALVQNTDAGTNTWTGLDITMPNITQTTGSVTSTGVKITGGTVTSGTSYGLLVGAGAGNVGIGLTAPTSILHVQQAADTTGTSTPVAFDVNSPCNGVGVAGCLTAASGTQTFARIAPVVNQSGTAAYTALLVNSTESAVGSGARKLLDLQRGGTSKFYVDTSTAASRVYIGSDTGASDTSYLYFVNDNSSVSPYIYVDNSANLNIVSTGNRAITIDAGEDANFYIKHGVGSKQVNLTTATGATAISWLLARTHASQGATTTSGSLLKLTSATDASVGYTTTGILLDMTTTGAAYTGNLMDLQTGSASKFTIKSGGRVIYPASATQSITGVGSTISADATMVVLDPDGNYTLTSAPTIADGTTGQILYITAGNAEANIVTVQDQDSLASSNLQLGAASRAISGKDVLVLMFDGTDWLEVSFANN